MPLAGAKRVTQGKLEESNIAEMCRRTSVATATAMKTASTTAIAFIWGTNNGFV